MAWLVPGNPKMPMVIFFHGNAANISYRVDILQFFHEMGFSVFIFDYKGFGESHGKSTSEEDLYTDARSALDVLKGRGWSSSHMIYFGRSMGAAVALQMGLEFPPAVVVLECPFTNMSEIAWHTAPVTYALIGGGRSVLDLTTSIKLKSFQHPWPFFREMRIILFRWKWPSGFFSEPMTQKLFTLFQVEGTAIYFKSAVINTGMHGWS